MNARATRARSGRLRGTSRRTHRCTAGSATRVKPETPPAGPIRGNADGAHRPPQLCTPAVVTVHTDRPCGTDARPLTSVSAGSWPPGRADSVRVTCPTCADGITPPDAVGTTQDHRDDMPATRRRRAMYS